MVPAESKKLMDSKWIITLVKPHATQAWVASTFEWAWLRATQEAQNADYWRLPVAITITES